MLSLSTPNCSNKRNLTKRTLHVNGISHTCILIGLQAANVPYICVTPSSPANYSNVISLHIIAIITVRVSWCKTQMRHLFCNHLFKAITSNMSLDGSVDMHTARKLLVMYMFRQWKIDILHETQPTLELDVNKLWEEFSELGIVETATCHNNHFILPHWLHKIKQLEYQN